MTLNTAGTRQSSVTEGPLVFQYDQPLNPEYGWVGWKMQAAALWDSFSTAAKQQQWGKNQGGLERLLGMWTVLKQVNRFQYLL